MEAKQTNAKTDIRRSLIFIFCIVSLAKAQVAGLWQFNDAGNLTKATVGTDLILRGSGQSSVPGISGFDGAVAVESGTYYQCEHGIRARGPSDAKNR